MGCKRHPLCEVYVCCECRNEALDNAQQEADRWKREATDQSLRATTYAKDIDAVSRLLVAANEMEGHPGAYAALMIERDGYKNTLTKIAETAHTHTSDWCRREALFGLGKGEPASEFFDRQDELSEALAELNKADDTIQRLNVYKADLKEALRRIAVENHKHDPTHIGKPFELCDRSYCVMARSLLMCSSGGVQ